MYRNIVKREYSFQIPHHSGRLTEKLAIVYATPPLSPTAQRKALDPALATVKGLPAGMEGHERRSRQSNTSSFAGSQSVGAQGQGSLLHHTRPSGQYPTVSGAGDQYQVRLQASHRAPPDQQPWPAPACSARRHPKMSSRAQSCRADWRPPSIAAPAGDASAAGRHYARLCKDVRGDGLVDMQQST